MTSKMFQEIPAGKEREDVLDANCSKKEPMLVKRHFTQEELEKMRIEFTQKSIQYAEYMVKLNEIKAEYKALMLPILESTRADLKGIRTGYTEDMQDVFLFDDQVDGMMRYYDRTGEEILSRRLTQEERQVTIHTAFKKVAE